MLESKMILNMNSLICLGLTTQTMFQTIHNLIE